MRKITAGITILVSALTLTACGHSNSQKAPNSGTQKVNPSMQISKTLTKPEIDKMVKKAAKVSTDSGESTMTIKGSSNGKKVNQKMVSKFSAPTDTMYRKLTNKGQSIQLWGKGDKIYVNNTGKWISGTSKKNNGHIGVKSAQKSLKSLILNFSSKNVIDHVVAKRLTGVGLNGMVSLSYDVTMYQREALTHLKGTMLVSETTGNVRKLTFTRSTPQVVMKGNFNNINEYNDLTIPKKVTQNAIQGNVIG